jgi:hypothetical protein
VQTNVLVSKYWNDSNDQNGWFQLSHHHYCWMPMIYYFRCRLVVPQIGMTAAQEEMPVQANKRNSTWTWQPGHPLDNPRPTLNYVVQVPTEDAPEESHETKKPLLEIMKN